MKKLIAFVTMIIAISTPSYATAQNADAEFCSLSPIGMLQALEDDWTLSPGAGVALASGMPVAMPIPLPPQPPQPLRFDFDGETGTINIKDKSTGEDFLMVPTTKDAAEVALFYAKDWFKDDYMQPGDGCDWDAMPLMISTTAFSWYNGPEMKKNGATGIFAGVMFEYCAFGYSGPSSSDPVDGGEYDTRIIDPKIPANLIVGPNDKCVGPPGGKYTQPKSGDLMMNLILKFQTPNRATGVLYFEGIMSGRRAGAVRPVTLTRN